MKTLLSPLGGNITTAYMLRDFYPRHGRKLTEKEVGVKVIRLMPQQDYGDCSFTPEKGASAAQLRKKAYTLTKIHSNGKLSVTLNRVSKICLYQGFNDENWLPVEEFIERVWIQG